MATTRIPYADVVWNPTTGCSHASRGCDHCYAERMAMRRMPGWEAPRKWTDVRCHPERLAYPSTLKKPRRIFVGSMSDLFHKDVPDEFIARVFCEMDTHQRHTFLLLTKRPERAAQWAVARGETFDTGTNIWWGFSAEDQSAWDKRWPVMRKLQEQGHNVWASLEPLLGPIWMGAGLIPGWVVVGHESGTGARFGELDWIEAVEYQVPAGCGSSLFVKQISSAFAGHPVSDPTAFPIHLRRREIPA